MKQNLSLGLELFRDEECEALNPKLHKELDICRRDPSETNLDFEVLIGPYSLGSIGPLAQNVSSVSSTPNGAKPEPSALKPRNMQPKRNSVWVFQGNSSAPSRSGDVA